MSLVYLLVLSCLISFCFAGINRINLPGSTCANATSNSCNKQCSDLLDLFKKQYSHGWAVRHQSLGDVFEKLQCRKVIEIGVARGELSRYLVKTLHRKGLLKEYHGVDPFIGGYDDRDAMSKELKDVSQPESWKDAILHLLAPYNCLFQLHYGISEDRVADFEDESMDCVFFDGDHTYEGIKKDIDLYAPKVRKGGALLFDDYSSSFMGVVNAIDELVDVNRLDFKKINTHNNYYVVKPADRPLDTKYRYPDDDKVPLPPTPTF